MPFLSVRPPRGARAGIVRCHLRRAYGLRTYNFSNLYNFSLNKIVEAAEPVNSTKISQPPPASALRPRGSRTERGIQAP